MRYMMPTNIFIIHISKPSNDFSQTTTHSKFITEVRQVVTLV
jgi:hypothetical protein